MLGAAQSHMMARSHPKQLAHAALSASRSKSGSCALQLAAAGLDCSRYLSVGGWPPALKPRHMQLVINRSLDVPEVDDAIEIAEKIYI